MDLAQSQFFRLAAFLTLLAVAGCGVDGEPIQPTMNLGLGLSTDGSAHVGGGVGLSQGPVSLFMGF